LERSTYNFVYNGLKYRQYYIVNQRSRWNEGRRWNSVKGRPPKGL